MNFARENLSSRHLTALLRDVNKMRWHAYRRVRPAYARNADFEKGRRAKRVPGACFGAIGITCNYAAAFHVRFISDADGSKQSDAYPLDQQLFTHGEPPHPPPPLSRFNYHFERPLAELRCARAGSRLMFYLRAAFPGENNYDSETRVLSPRGNNFVSHLRTSPVRLLTLLFLFPPLCRSQLRHDDGDGGYERVQVRRKGGAGSTSCATRGQMNFIVSHLTFG